LGLFGGGGEGSKSIDVRAKVMAGGVVSLQEFGGEAAGLKAWQEARGAMHCYHP
jgi:hypothetical protein